MLNFEPTHQGKERRVMQEDEARLTESLNRLQEALAEDRKSLQRFQLQLNAMTNDNERRLQQYEARTID